MASNGAMWAFGGAGVPMGSGVLGNSRPNNSSMTSFAQTIGGSSQPATPLDMSEFPSLSNNQPQPSQSTWAGVRGIGPSSSIRLQQSTLSSQQQMSNQQQTQQQDELFGTSSQFTTTQSNFRFGNQNTVGQSAQPTSPDEFPPLSRNSNGDIGQDRSSNMIQNVGFGAQSNGVGFGSSNAPQNRNNGLLNALSGSTRIHGNRVSSPTAVSGLAARSIAEASRQGSSGVAESESSTFSSQFTSSAPLNLHEEAVQQSTMPSAVGSSTRPDGAPPQPDTATHTGESGVNSKANAEDSAPEVQDPIAHMNDIDKFGLKGFSYLMNNYPDYAALVAGSDVTALGFDLNSPEPFSNQQYSLFDTDPPRPVVPRHDLPDCYRVANIAPLESKMTNFNDEALIFMFYTNPGDIQQVMAAQELHGRNWRYHKKLKVWLTKDEMMVPQPLGNGTERGYYIFFDIKQWVRERREFTLVYDDLENQPPSGLGAPGGASGPAAANAAGVSSGPAGPRGPLA